MNMLVEDLICLDAWTRFMQTLENLNVFLVDSFNGLLPNQVVQTAPTHIARV